MPQKMKPTGSWIRRWKWVSTSLIPLIATVENPDWEPLKKLLVAGSGKAVGVGTELSWLLKFTALWLIHQCPTKRQASQPIRFASTPPTRSDGFRLTTLIFIRYIT